MTDKDTNDISAEVNKGRLNSLYDGLPALIVGTLNYSFASWLCFAATGNDGFLILICLFGFVGLIRLANWGLFVRAREKGFKQEEIDYWSNRNVALGTMTAFLLGMLCLFSIVYTNNDFAKLVSISVSLASTAGIAARNFASVTMVALQVAAIGLPLIYSLMHSGSNLEKLLVILYITYMIAVSSMAKSLRQVLQNAIDRELEKAEMTNKLSIALETMPNGLLMFEDQTTLSIVNEEAKNILQLELDEDHDEFSLDQLIDHLRSKKQTSPRSLVELKKVFQAARTDSKQHEVQLKCVGGQSLRLVVRSDKKKNLVIRLDDITSQVESKNQMINMARFDALTGLANRAWFFTQAERLLFEKQSNVSVVAAVMDIDDFKSINDTYGHPTGDALIRAIAKKLSKISSDTSISSRFGGDEFVLLFVSENANSDELHRLSHMLSEMINGRYLLGDIEINVKCSIGLAMTDTAKSGIDDLISRADYAQYKAKREGDGVPRIFESNMEATMLRRRALKTDLKIAIDRGEIYSAFQPIVSVEKNRPVAFEALARWQHPEFGNITPAEFIPLAEEAGLISEITRVQLLNACRICNNWPNDISVSVNLSAVDFRNEKVLQSIADGLKLSGLSPSRLIAEVTETSLLDLKAETLNKIEQIRAMGVKLALDDFGVGYSSLNYLHRLNLDRVKLDKSFIDDIETSDKTQTVMSNIVRLATELNIEVIIEGVENINQLKVIRGRVRADLFQGYLFSAPIPEAQVLKFIESRTISEDVTDNVVAFSA